jgi:hypothetical protein
MEISFDMRAVASTDVVTRRLDDELVLLDLGTENYFGLDEVGTHMWEVLASSPRVQDAYDRLLTTYDVDAGTLRRDMEKLLSELVEHGLIELQAN